MKNREENCIVLDYLANGYPDRRQSEPIAQALGTSHYSLLEIVPKKEASLKPEEEVYIGEEEREKIKFVKGQIDYSKLTNMASTFLEHAVEKAVKENEEKTIKFFNTAGMLTPRMHKIQLLPGIGKKHLLDLLEERQKKPFESFQDMEERVKLFPDPVKTVAKRVVNEIKGEEKYYLFVEGKEQQRR